MGSEGFKSAGEWLALLGRVLDNDCLQFDRLWVTRTTNMAADWLSNRGAEVGRGRVRVTRLGSTSS